VLFVRFPNLLFHYPVRQTVHKPRLLVSTSHQLWMHIRGGRPHPLGPGHLLLKTRRVLTVMPALALPRVNHEEVLAVRPHPTLLYLQVVHSDYLALR